MIVAVLLPSRCVGDSQTDDTLPAAPAATVASGIASGDTARAELLGSEVQLPNVEASSYELRELLGAGGMGKVVVARDRRLGRLLAIKVAQTADRSLRKRFTREAVLTARLQHPSIIPVHEAGVWAAGDEPFYAMKLVAGASLARLIAKTSTLDERLALIPNVIAVVDALAYAHSQRVIHRDLKPDNVIVGEYGETIVIDWGLAKELDAEDDPEEPAATGPFRRFDAGQTVQGAAMGTPPYMAPEQAAGERVDERADVYGLGAMLYHVMSGAAPYTGTSADEVMEQVLAGPPVPLAERQDGIPADLLAIVDKAMARAPGARYANAKYLAEDLKRFERGQLVKAHVYSMGELTRRWFAKHRAAVAVGLVAIAAIAVTLTVWIRAELRDRAAGERRIAEVLHADDTDHATAVAQLRAGDFSGAMATVHRQVDNLGAADHVSDRAHVRQDELARVTKLAAFYTHARAAAFLVGDEDRTEDGTYEMTQALREIGAIDATGRAVTTPWWNDLFIDELTPEQRAALQLEAYRLVLEVAALRFKAGALLVKMKLVFIEKSPAAAAHFRAGLDALALATPLEHALKIKPARVTRIWQLMTLYFLKGVGTDADVAAAGAGPLDAAASDEAAAENAMDYWFLGVGQYLVAQSGGTPLGKGMQLAFPEAFDYAHPLDTAEQELRAAIRFDPHLYWPHFMLGMALRDRGDFGGAELAFDACVMLEPSYLVGYGARALVLAKRAGTQAAGALRDETMARAVSDSQETLAKAPVHPVTYWARGDLMRALDQRSNAIEAYTRALELEDDVRGKFSGQVAMTEIAGYLETTLAPDDVAARDLLAFIAVASNTTDLAIDRASQALRLRPDDTRAHAILGLAYLETENLPAARASFEAALKIAPSNTLAALGLARVLEATAAPEQALSAYRSLSKIAVVREHQLQAQLGIYRLATKLGRSAEATAARASAQVINPARLIP